MKKNKARKGKLIPISDYDLTDSSGFIAKGNPLRFEHLGVRLPEVPPTQVVSIRLPSELLNQLRAIGSARDVPYQALIKLLLAEGVSELRKKIA